MDLREKEKLTHWGDMSEIACAIRLLAARKSTKMSQIDFAKACGVSKTAYNNAERALAFPNRKVMIFLFREHRIDFNFLMHGDFSQLPLDVQDRLFEKLADANNESGQK